MPEPTDPPHELDHNDAALHEKIALIHEAEADLLAAMKAYHKVINSEPALPPSPIAYAPSKALLDDHRYTIEAVNMHLRFGKDLPYLLAAEAENPMLQVVMLTQSPDWEDRVRATSLYASQRNEITLPDGFPCIYEPATSPRRATATRPRPEPWVVSPDEAMLHELLPLYEELWGAYQAQWPKSPKRIFEVGRLNGLSPNGVYRPGTTPAQVIANTMLTHTGMYATAPQHIREMHPMYERWTKKPVTA